MVCVKKLVECNTGFLGGRNNRHDFAVNQDFYRVHPADGKNLAAAGRNFVSVTRLEHLADPQFVLVFNFNPGFFVNLQKNAGTGLGINHGGFFGFGCGLCRFRRGRSFNCRCFRLNGRSFRLPPSERPRFRLYRVENQ